MIPRLKRHRVLKLLLIKLIKALSHFEFRVWVDTVDKLLFCDRDEILIRGEGPPRNNGSLKEPLVRIRHHALRMIPF